MPGILNQNHTSSKQGNEGKRHDGFLAGSRIVFDSSDSLHYLAVKNGNEVYLMQETMK
ncbi:MAG TPA: hypothetical protein VM163_02615 [bacterium]|nr:hypothetical protein [bacterium]